MTDTFDDLARAEARNQWSEPNRRLTRVGFVIGARWAKAHLEARQPTVEQVREALLAVRSDGHPEWVDDEMDAPSLNAVTAAIHALYTKEAGA